MTDPTDPIRATDPIDAVPAPRPSLRDIWQAAVGADGRLPPETELADLLGMGRNSVREVLIRLEAEGYIARRHGAGTFANPAAMDIGVRIDRTMEFAEVVRGLGHEARVELLEAGWVSPSPDIVEKLQVRDGYLVYRTCKRWLADGHPVMYAEDFIPAPRKVAVDAAKSVLVIAERANGHVTEWVSSLVEAQVAGDRADDLGVGRSTPLLRLEQVGVSRIGTRCWLAREYHSGSAGPLPLRYGLVRTVLPGIEETVDFAARG
ncbi:GntR family transcriptional regulator [Nocardioides sp. zg-ZUI104]|uniref:GntR family transcriptional regulator n=1 Tax=Nocardioides faecalis TaxID=2803858 RepID=UPI001BCF9AA8|nr:GntR family transcriptional regulator [Nocardioides faecalis]MBS4753138.1 GntR family transcriptional regulator [Nocardioides faecalis]